jgi:hypothetical protein
LERETRPEFALHRLDFSTFSPSPVTPMYLVVYSFGVPGRPATGPTLSSLFYMMLSCSTRVYRRTPVIRLARSSSFDAAPWLVSAQLQRVPVVITLTVAGYYEDIIDYGIF